MELSTSTKGNVVVVALKGRIDANTTLEVEQKLSSLISEGQCTLVADMMEVNFIASAGLRVLLAALKETRRNGGDLKLACLQTQVVEVLDMTGFSTLFKIYNTVEDAVGSFKQ